MVMPGRISKIVGVGNGVQREGTEAGWCWSGSEYVRPKEAMNYFLSSQDSAIASNNGNEARTENPEGIKSSRIRM